MSFGAIAIYPSTFTVDATDRDAVTAGALLRAWREDDKAADPFFDVHARFKAADNSYLAAEARLDEAEAAAKAKHGEHALLAKVQIGTNHTAGEPLFAFTDECIAREIARKIDHFRHVAHGSGETARVATAPGEMTPLPDIIGRLNAKGERLRADLAADAERVHAIREELGIKALDEVQRKAGDALNAATDELHACRPTTPAGVALKLRTVAENFCWVPSDPDDYGRQAFEAILADIEHLQPST